MSKILAFVVIFPLIAMLLFKAVAFYEYDTKQRYIKNVLDNAAYKVKITGVLTAEEYNKISIELNKIEQFQAQGIEMTYGTWTDGINFENLLPYSEGTILSKGDAFKICVKSANVSNFSMIQNLGVSEDESKNLRYFAKAVCRVEYSP